MKKVIFVLLISTLTLAKENLDVKNLGFGKKIEKQLNSSPTFLKDLVQFDLEVIALKVDFLSFGVERNKLTLKDLESYINNILAPEIERLSKNKIWPKKMQTQNQKNAVASLEFDFSNVKKLLKLVIKKAKRGSKQGILQLLSRINLKIRLILKMIDTLAKLFPDVKEQPVNVIPKVGGRSIDVHNAADNNYSDDDHYSDEDVPRIDEDDF